MTTIFDFEPSAAAILAYATAPLAELHELNSSVINTWLKAMVCEEELSEKVLAPLTRSGVVSFRVGGEEENIVTVEVKVVLLIKADGLEIWSGKSVNCKSQDWEWSYCIDWKTGEKVHPMTNIGTYPFSEMHFAESA